MNSIGDILEEFLKRIISSPAQESILNDLVSLFEYLIVDKKCLPNLDIPYDDITTFIYDFKEDINLKDLDSMMEELENRFSNRYPADINTGKKHDKHHCFSKFRTHIFLAATQKSYIKKVTQELARNANHVANLAERTAKNAQDEAEKARNMYDGMMVNYITILGIFASIIITIFGGMQVISATTGLLQANLSLATLILVLSFLTVLIVLILAILLNWISNLKESKRSNKFVYIALMISALSISITGGYMLKYKNIDFTKINSKVLIKNEKEDK